MNLNKIHTKLPFHADTRYRRTLVNKNKELPNPINILYQDMMSVKRFLLSMEGEYLVKLAKDGQFKLNFYPDDVYNNGMDYEFSITNEFYNILHQEPNIKIYNTEWHCNETNYHTGLAIQKSLTPFIKQCRDINFKDCNKQYHFLTLNNIGKSDREELFKFFKKNTDVDSKSLSSFIWMGKTLDKLKLQRNSITGQKERSDLYNPLSLRDFYSKCAFEIVCESGNNMITEKILKPLIVGVPFLIHTSHLYSL